MEKNVGPNVVLTDIDGNSYEGTFDGIFEAKWGRKRNAELTVRLQQPVQGRELAMPLSSVKSLFLSQLREPNLLTDEK
jgi:hypothetical protein